MTADDLRKWQLKKTASLGAALCISLITKAKTAHGSERDFEMGLGFGAHVPLSRPFLDLSWGIPVGGHLMSVRANVSYLPLTSSFAGAAAASQYADKLTTDSASLVDIALFLPEFQLSLPASFFITAAPSVRTTLVQAKYKTTSLEPVAFAGLGVATQAALAGGYNIRVSPDASLDLFTQVQIPFWSLGWSEMNYQRDNSTSVPTLTDSDIELMLESLQPYAQRVTQQITAGAGLRLKYRF